MNAVRFRSLLLALLLLPMAAPALERLSREDGLHRELFERTVGYYTAWTYTRTDTVYDEAGVYYSQQPDLVFWDPLPPLVGYRGWPEYRQVIEKVWKPAGMLAAGILLARDGSFEAWRHDDLALVTGNCLVHAEFADKPPATMPCRGTQLWRREAGTWLLVHEHFSAPVGPQERLFQAARPADARLHPDAAFLARARAVAEAWGAGPLAEAAARLRPFYARAGLTRLYLPWPPHDGHPDWAEFVAGLAGYAGRAAEHLGLQYHDDLEASVHGDLAWTTATLDLAFELPDGRVNRASGRQTLVWLREGGEWRIAHEHLSIPAGAGGP